MRAISASFAPYRILYIDDRNPRRRTQFSIEERLFRREVVLHRAVIIEVILREVGEDRHIVGQSVDSSLSQGVR